MATQMRMKTLKIGAIWSGGTTEWFGNGSFSRDTQELAWIQDLMFHPEAKVAVMPNSYKTEDRQPDFNLVLSLPEDQMPQEYWDMMEDSRARRESRGQSDPPNPRGSRPAPTPTRGRGEYDQRPRGDSGGRTYGGGSPAPTRSREPYPPRQERAARPARRDEVYDEPESAPPPRSTPRSGRGVPRELPPEDDDIVDPFED